MSQASIPSFYFNTSEKEYVPVEHVFSLALTETNTPLNTGTSLPWPYSINWQSKTYLFTTQAEMVNFAKSLLDNGYENFDIGLFQINWYWNGKHRTKNVSDIAHPSDNARMAMTILKEHYAKTSDWIEAAGRYHNPANKNGAADRYKEKYMVHLNRTIGVLYE